MVELQRAAGDGCVVGIGVGLRVVVGGQRPQTRALLRDA